MCVDVFYFRMNSWVYNIISNAGPSNYYFSINNVGSLQDSLNLCVIAF